MAGGDIKYKRVNHSYSYRGLDAFENFASNMKTRPTFKLQKGFDLGLIFANHFY